MMLVSRTTRIISPGATGIHAAPFVPRNFRVDLVHGKLIQAGFLGALP